MNKSRVNKPLSIVLGVVMGVVVSVLLCWAFLPVKEPDLSPSTHIQLICVPTTMATSTVMSPLPTSTIESPLPTPTQRWRPAEVLDFSSWSATSTPVPTCPACDPIVVTVEVTREVVVASDCPDCNCPACNCPKCEECKACPDCDCDCDCDCVWPTATPIPTAMPTVTPTPTPTPTEPRPTLPPPTEPPPTEPPRPAPTQTASPPPTPTPANVVCDCSGDVYNCPDFTTQTQAQACYNYCMQVTGRDVHGLDGDDDGQACETLP